MSVKRPRAEYPQEIFSQKGSQLRDILESRPPPPPLNSQIVYPIDQRRQNSVETPKSFAPQPLNSPPTASLQPDLLQPLNYSSKGPGGSQFVPQKRILPCDSTCDPYNIPSAYLAGLMNESVKHSTGSVSSSLQYPSSPSDTTSSGDSSEAQTPPATLVPIFALHPAGLFYVPLAIPNSQLEAVGYGRYQNPTANSLSALIQSCHPVTISVQFEMGRVGGDSLLQFAQKRQRQDDFMQRPMATLGQKSFLPKSLHLPDPSFGQRQNDLIPPQSHFARTNVILAPASSSDNRQLRVQNY